MLQLKILYVSSKGSIHDYRFLEKLIIDYDVMLLHYAADNMIPEIKSLPKLKIVSKKPIVKSFPLLSELGHFKKIYNSFKPDIVHTGYLWQVGVLAAYSGVHPHLSMPWGSDVLIQPDKNPFLKILAKKVLETADHIHCDAEFVKKKITTDYKVPPSKITVFPRGIDLGIFKVLDKLSCRDELKIPEDKFVIGYSRPLEPIYDVDTLLKGYYDFSRDKKDVILLMANDGSLMPRVKNAVEKFNLQEKIRLLGLIPNTGIPQLFNACDVYVSTSLSDGTSLSLLEAMACGKGLVITRIPTNAEWVDESNGIFIETKNFAELSAGLNKYYYNRELIKQHGEMNVKIAKERADWDKNFPKLEEIYRNLTGGKAGN